MITFDELQLIHSNFPLLFPALTAVLGACVGSFLNVCILRIPEGKSVIRPGSHCACGQPIAWHDNIPILSWLILRGRARCCGRAFSIRYPAIELLTALVFLGCAIMFPPAKAIASMLFASLLILGSFTDIDHMIIPDRCTIGGAVLGVLLSVLIPSLHGRSHELFMVASLQSGTDSVLGLCVGSAVVLWIGLIAEKVLHKEAMGFGDVKLLGCIGAFLGWQGALFSIFGGAVLGVIATLAWLPFSRSGKTDTADAPVAEQKTGDEESPGLLGMPVPFGPMLSAAALLHLLCLQPYVAAYFKTIAEIVEKN
jgi:leader peptidase (prepilin peptidase)/N-methyltransferase